MTTKTRLFLSLAAIATLKIPVMASAAESILEAPPYAIPFTDSKKINKTKCVDSKNQALIHRDGLELKLPNFKEPRNASYERFDFLLIC